jgi:hypothetical protein
MSPRRVAARCCARPADVTAITNIVAVTAHRRARARERGEERMSKCLYEGRGIMPSLERKRDADRTKALHLLFVGGSTLSKEKP